MKSLDASKQVGFQIAASHPMLTTVKHLVEREHADRQQLETFKRLLKVGLRYSYCLEYLAHSCRYKHFLRRPQIQTIVLSPYPMRSMGLEDANTST